MVIVAVVKEFIADIAVICCRCTERDGAYKHHNSKDNCKNFLFHTGVSL